MLEGWNNLAKITPAQSSTVDVKTIRDHCYEAMNDDLSTPIVISHLFEAVKIINTVLAGENTLSADDLAHLKETFAIFLFGIMGIREESNTSDEGNEAYHKAVDLLLDVRKEAKARKDWATSDYIRDKLSEIGFEIKDTKEGVEWKLK